MKRLDCFRDIAHVIFAIALVGNTLTAEAQNISDSQVSNSILYVYSFLSVEDVQRLGGIPKQAVVGHVTRPGLSDRQFTPETFRPNTLFREFLHEVLGQCGLKSPGMREEARRIGDGYVYLIDGRTPTPQGRVPPEDIIGNLKAKSGRLVPGSYQANSDHRIVSDRGLFRLPRELHECLIEAMRNLPLLATKATE